MCLNAVQVTHELYLFISYHFEWLKVLFETCLIITLFSMLKV